jgi:hypothetical protein
MRALGPFVWVIMLLLPPALRGQQPITFDTVTFNQVGSFAVGHAVFETASGFLCFSLQKGSAGQSQDLFTGHFDSGGGLLGETSFATYQQDYAGSSSAVLAPNQAYYAGVARFGVLGPLDSLFLYRFTNDGDTAWTKFIAVDTTLTMRGTALESDQDVLLCGRHDPGREAYVYHLDSIGNIKGFHGYPWFDAEDVAIGPTDRWYLAGIGNHTGNYSRNVVVGSDTNGVELWRFTDLTQYGYTKGLVPLMGGAVVAVGTAGQSSGPASCFATKFLPDGTVVWAKYPWTSDQFNRPCQLLTGYEAPDSTLILAGWYRDATVYDAGMLFKLDAQGNTLWHRFYTHYPGASFGKDQIFWDVKPTSDGGMVLTGETNSDAFPYAQLWLLKLDSAGCLVPGCQFVGLSELTDSYWDAIKAYPNPSTGRFTLELTLPATVALAGDLTLQVFDAQGRLVERRNLGRQLEQRIALDLTAQPTGLYSAHLSDGKRILTGVRLVVSPP